MREKLTQIVFKVSHETLAALNELEAMLPGDIKVGRRSAAIREAIHEAHKRLTNQSNKEPTT